MTTDIFRSAKFSECGKYRYWLYREWNLSKPKALCIGLNPSTANGEDDDPTIESVTRMLQHNGYGAFYMMNLFALISSEPTDLRSCPDPVKNNDLHIGPVAMKVDIVVFCWGNFPMASYRAKQMKQWFPDALCFGKNKDGSPRHPLYKKSNTPLIRY